MRKLLALTALALAGCAATQQPIETSSLREPYPTEWRSKTAAYIKANWKDPQSIRDAEIAAPLMEVIPPQMAGILPPRWVVCVRMNAKNSFGGYTGRRVHYVRMEKDQVAHAVATDHLMTTCDAAKWEPFAEVNGKG